MEEGGALDGAVFPRKGAGVGAEHFFRKMGELRRGKAVPVQPDGACGLFPGLPREGAQPLSRLPRDKEAAVLPADGEGDGHLGLLGEHESDEPLLHRGEALEPVEPDLPPGKPAVLGAEHGRPAQGIEAVYVMLPEDALVEGPEEGEVGKLLPERPIPDARFGQLEVCAGEAGVFKLRHLPDHLLGKV